MTGDELHRWLGNTLATLHTLAPATRDQEAELAQSYGVFPDTDWVDWFAQAERAGLPWPTAAFELRPVIAEATRLVQAALADPLQPRSISHRDLNPPNVLTGPTGPLLCDFGSSGIDVPWFEAIDVTLSFDQEEPITLHSYLAANGPPGPESTEALARQPGRTMSFLAFGMWLSLGNRPVTDRQREEAAARIPGLMRELSTQVESLDANRRMLFGR